MRQEQNAALRALSPSLWPWNWISPSTTEKNIIGFLEVLRRCNLQFKRIGVFNFLSHLTQGDENELNGPGTTRLEQALTFPGHLPSSRPRPTLDRVAATEKGTGEPAEPRWIQNPSLLSTSPPIINLSVLSTGTTLCSVQRFHGISPFLITIAVFVLGKEGKNIHAWLTEPAREGGYVWNTPTPPHVKFMWLSPSANPNILSIPTELGTCESQPAFSLRW